MDPFQFKTAQHYRLSARKTLFQRWSAPVLTTLILIIFNAVCTSSYTFRHEEITYVVSVGGIVLFLTNGPLMRGYYGIFLKIVRNQAANIEHLFDGFRDYARSFILNLLISIFVCLWMFLFIIPGIVMAYAYSMSYYILIDNPAMSANAARKASVELMRGNKGRLFCLHLSYIGWHLLALLTFGVLELWILPQIQVATAQFYLDRIAERTPQTEQTQTTQHGHGGTYDGNYPLGDQPENAANKTKNDDEKKNINPFDDFSEH